MNGGEQLSFCGMVTDGASQKIHLTGGGRTAPTYAGQIFDVNSLTWETQISLSVSVSYKGSTVPVILSSNVETYYMFPGKDFTSLVSDVVRYNPASGGSFEVVGTMANSRYRHTAFLVPEAFCPTA